MRAYISCERYASRCSLGPHNQSLGRTSPLWRNLENTRLSLARAKANHPRRVRTYARFFESTRALRPRTLLEGSKEGESKFRNGNKKRNMWSYFSTDPVNISVGTLDGRCLSFSVSTLRFPLPNFKAHVVFGTLFMGAARRAAQDGCKSSLSAPLEILQFPWTDSLTLFACYGSVCRMLYDNDGKKRLFKKRYIQSKRSYSRSYGLYQGQWRLGGCKKPP